MNDFEEVYRKVTERYQRRMDASIQRMSDRPRFDKPPPILSGELSRAIALEWLALQRYEGDWQRDPGHPGGRAAAPFHLANPPTDQEYEEEYRRLMEGEHR